MDAGNLKVKIEAIMYTMEVELFVSTNEILSLLKPVNSIKPAISFI